MKVIMIDLCRPRRAIQSNLPSAYVVILGILAVKGWMDLWK
ncbi:hypothetical protein SAMN05421868_1342 [Paenibacillus naphthalenovorans]|nr:hypothetical protein SAMN05421868_1342 [Paenibacillus naphthalenovorans]